MTQDQRYTVKFGGWFGGDNHKPGRGWYFVCECGHVGLGQLLPQSAVREAHKHLTLGRCLASGKETEPA